MKKETTTKLYLKAAAPRSLRCTDTTVWVPGELYRQLDTLSQRTGLSNRELVGILLRYALENTVIQRASDAEEY